MRDLLLVGARVLQFAGSLVFMGASMFQLYGQQSRVRPLSPNERSQWPRHVLVMSALVAMAGTLLWIVAETVLFSGDPAEGTNPSAVWLVFSETRFGRVCLLRMGLLLFAVAVTRFMAPSKSYWVLQSTLGAGILATFAWTGHGAMSDGWAGVIHAGADILHLWVAGVWFGALVPLVILITQAHRRGSLAGAREARFALDRFSAIGAVVVSLLAVTGLINSWFLIGIENLQSSLSTDYGKVLLIKLGIFGLMLLIAAANRFWLAPRLQLDLTSASSESGGSLRALQISIVTEGAMAALLLVAVGVLGTLPPPFAGA